MLPRLRSEPGEVVPRPSQPLELMTDCIVPPPAAKMSKMSAVCAAAGMSASVVVAGESEESTSLANGVEEASPIDTRSDDVARLPVPTLFVVQPPAVERPRLATLPQ